MIYDSYLHLSHLNKDWYRVGTGGRGLIVLRLRDNGGGVIELTFIL